MRIDYITAGAGGMICGNCLLDNTLAASLLELGHNVRLVPIYTPIKVDEVDVSLNRVFVGGINAFLQQKFSLFRATPDWLDKLFDHPLLLNWAAKFAVKTDPKDLGELTVSVLEGSDGQQSKEIAKLIDWMTIDPPDILHLTNSMLAGLASPAKKILGIPVVCSLQGEHHFLEHLPSPYREKAFGYLLKKSQSIDTFIAPGRDQAIAMAPRLGVDVNEINVISPGLSLKGFQPGSTHAREEFRIGYMARVSPEKGLDLLADAFVQIRRRHGDTSPTPRLLVAGWLDPHHRSYLEKISRKVSDAGFSADFEYLGEIDRTEKIRFLSNLDVLSVPVSYPASKGLYALEAMASATPVIQPDLGIFPELIKATGGGLLHKPGDVGDLVSKLEQLLENRDQVSTLGQQGRNAVLKNFDIRRTAEETVQVYRNLC
ncbi:MAG: hexosyltransferase [Solibacterales bacterium]|nr:hexosyltransferase [Bryobacterales bacterium]|tara:strand:+ start:5343 stop:6629 length:1287 start_codon:yes stop_codon:yes gene_type:complete